MKASAWKNSFGTFLLACVLAAGSFAARAQDPGKPLLLVASPKLQGAYRETTLMAVPVGDKHVGFILNRATDVKLSILFPEHPPSAAVTEPVYIGGPEMHEALFAIVRRKPVGRSMELFGGLFVTGDAKAINQIIEQTPNDARYFAGFVGWQSGELESEIARGLWHVAEPDSELVFSHDTSGMWQEQVKRLGITPRAPRDRNLLETNFRRQM